MEVGRGWRDETPAPHLLPAPVPGRDHQLRGLAIPRVQPEPAGYRAAPGRTRRVRDPREHPRVVRKVRAEFANRLRRRRSRPGDIWHLDEVFIRINGELHYLWRAVDQYGVVL